MGGQRLAGQVPKGERSWKAATSEGQVKGRERHFSETGITDRALASGQPAWVCSLLPWTHSWLPVMSPNSPGAAGHAAPCLHCAEEETEA